MPGRSNLRIRCPKGHGGSTPPSRTLQTCGSIGLSASDQVATKAVSLTPAHRRTRRTRLAPPARSCAFGRRSRLTQAGEASARAPLPAATPSSSEQVANGSNVILVRSASRLRRCLESKARGDDYPAKAMHDDVPGDPLQLHRAPVDLEVGDELRTTWERQDVVGSRRSRLHRPTPEPGRRC